MAPTLPGAVAAALDRARQAGLPHPCEPEVGQLLAALAAAVPPGGRALELGTGAGVALAWLVHGLGGRQDVEVVSAGREGQAASLAAAWPWPPFVRLVTGGVPAALASGPFDLIRARAGNGAPEDLERAAVALRPGGHLVVDGTLPGAAHDRDHRAKVGEARARLLGHPDLVPAEIAWSSGVILCTRRGTGAARRPPPAPAGEVAVRRVQPGDGPRLRDIRLRALADAPSAFASTYEQEQARTAQEWEEAATRYATSNTHATFVAMAGGRWVGIVGAFHQDHRPGHVELVSMWTDPAYRRRGVATALVGHALTWAEQTGAEQVGLWVTRGNDAAIRLYETLGFTPTGEYQPLPSDPCKGELRMTRPLRGGAA